MNEQPDKVSEVKKWIDKAEHDLIAAKYMIELADLQILCAFIVSSVRKSA